MTRSSISLLLLLVFTQWAIAQQSRIQTLRDSLAHAQDEKTNLYLRFELARALAIDSPDVALREATAASLIAQKSENEKYIAKSYRVLGGIYYDQGKYPLAIEHYKKSLEHSKTIRDTSSIATNLNNIGRAHRRMGNYQEAMENFYESLNMSATDREMVGVISNNLAMVLNDVGEDSLALQYYKQSLEIAEEMRDTSSMILSLNNLGGQYDRMNELSRSEACYYQALQLAEKINDVESFGLTYDNMGALWEDRGDYEKALSYYLKELEVERKVGVKVYIAEALGAIAGAYLKLNEYKKAEAYAKECFSMSEEIQSDELRAHAAGILSLVYEKENKLSESIYYMRLEHSILDSLTSVDKAKTIANMASHYELTKKEGEIRALNLEKKIQDTQLKQESRIRYGLISFLAIVLVMLIVTVYQYRERKKASDMLMVWSKAIDEKNQELEKLNKVKDKVFSSISHDVRSPLAAIQGVLSLMSVQALSPEELHLMSVELSAKVNSTSALLENLLNWSKNQIANATTKPVKADIKQLVDECVELYRNNLLQKNLTVLNQVPAETYAFADVEMIRIVLRNLISNAIKFTNIEGEIKITSSHQNGLVCISVSDSGVGIPEESISTLFSLEAHTTSGTANEKGTGLGLILCKDFVEKNGGQIWVESIAGKGSTFSFTAPIS